MEANVNTKHLNILEGFFYDLSTMNQRAVLIKAYRKASKPLVRKAKDYAPRGRTGNLKHSIGIMAVPRDIAILVGARKGGGSKGWHGHLVESGTKERIRKDGSSTGRVIGQRFFERAYEQTIEEVYDGVESEWYEELDKYIKRVNKKL